ncbi:hypothetical protein [Micromonospora sp. CPCC 206061]|uniref:hypothetical protein n=1 Tax=Micromonospora sp. CPCC 206061 TaxID=3122410 RepID=UPI002FF36F91
MNLREVAVTILLGPGVFLCCVVVLGMVNAMLWSVLRAKLLDPEFVLAGRWGLGPTIRRVWRADLEHGTSGFSSVSVAAAWVQVFAAVGGGLTATIVLWPVPVPQSWLAGPGAAVGVLVYSVLLWRGIRAVSRPRLVVYGRLVNRPARAAATLAAFLYWVWSKTVNMAWALSGVFLLAQLVGTAWGRPEDEILGLVGVAFLTALATVPVVLLVTGIVDEFWIGVVTRRAIAMFLASQGRARRPRRPTGAAYYSPHRVPDRFAADRASLGRIAELLARAADRIDRSVPAPARPQPVATLLRGAVDVLTVHLRSLRSAAGPTTPEIYALLQTVAAVLVGPWRGAAYDELNRQVNGFDPDGRPAERLPTLGERSLTRYARRIADAVDTSHRLAVAVLGLASLAYLVYLVGIGHRGLSEVFRP